MTDAADTSTVLSLTSTTSPMGQDITHYIQCCQSRVNQTLQALLAPRISSYAQFATDSANQTLWQALEYSVMNGGKRLRPALFFATAEALGGEGEHLSRIAAALEMIHSYSLVHDDLPAMDNDDLRRGKPTCHIAFDEATAILAGDALQAEAFTVLSETDALSAEIRIRLVQELSTASGVTGMVGGQALDLAVANTSAAGMDIDYLEAMHRLKTGALIRSSVKLAAICCAASDAEIDALTQFATSIGLAFQVHDDILDIEADTATLGKTQGSDIAKNKPTYPALLGMPAAKQKARDLHVEALAALSPFGEAADRLRQLADFVVDRGY